MRISDWSSEVCSSDLLEEHADPKVIEVFGATWAVLAEKGVFDAQDFQRIVEKAEEGFAALRTRVPNQKYAGGHSYSGPDLSGSELVDEATADPFPARDPPSYTPSAGDGSPPRHRRPSL